MNINRNMNLEILLKNISNMEKVLNNIEKDFNPKYEKIKQRSEINRIIDQKLAELVKIQNLSERLTVNVGGEIYEITKSSMVNCRYNNILKKRLIEDYDISNEFFLDMSGKIFEMILDIIDILSNENSEFNQPIEIKIFNEKSNFVEYSQIEESIKYFFEEDYEKVLSDFKFKIFYNN